MDKDNKQKSEFLKEFTNVRFVKVNKLLLYLLGFSLISYGLSQFYHNYLLKKLKNQIQSASDKTKAIVELKIKKLIKIPEKNIHFNFYLMENLGKKPTSGQTQQSNNPFLPPFEKGIFVAQLSPTHNLLFNKFAIVKNHMLVVTKGLKKQNEELDANDFTAAATVMMALEGFIFFNSGPDAGASQEHRHLQIMPKQALDESPILQIIIKMLQINAISDKFEAFDFLHKIYKLDKLNMDQSFDKHGQYLENVYKQAMKDLHNEDLYTPYNIIITEKFFFMVLRRQEKAFNLYATNAMGFTGSFLLKNQEQVDQLQKYSPLQILNEVTIKDYQLQQDVEDGTQ